MFTHWIIGLQVYYPVYWLFWVFIVLCLLFWIFIHTHSFAVMWSCVLHTCTVMCWGMTVKVLNEAFDQWQKWSTYHLHKIKKFEVAVIKLYYSRPMMLSHSSAEEKLNQWCLILSGKGCCGGRLSFPPSMKPYLCLVKGQTKLIRQVVWLLLGWNKNPHLPFKVYDWIPLSSTVNSNPFFSYQLRQHTLFKLLTLLGCSPPIFAVLFVAPL